MATEVLMPALSPTMTEGKIARWLKSEGEQVSAGDVLAEIETDKATMEVEAVDEGMLARIVIPEGTDHVAVNTPIAVIAANGEDAGPRPAGPNGREPPAAAACRWQARGAATCCRAAPPAARPRRASGRARIHRRHPHDHRARGVARRDRRGDAARRHGLPDGRGGRRISGRLQGQPGPARRNSARAASSTRRSPSRALPGSASAPALPGCGRSSSS